ncbi:DNA-binding response regulator [Nakamurella antarctica]|uniref:DNA-binding response regulator n=1 Tax=Nakamurella antarctica TaxID=1902245 RepID=A0A3G8ZNF6_9ACTN|nr:response regulator transcription factor [Nakamurella antarctica]AZI58790.1 DNA-binding response regulator [Nakamurella antarctica]
MRILVVEDEPLLAKTIERGLRAEGFVVELAADGEVGLEMALVGAFDVIVLDIMLPKLNGYNVLRGLRKAEVWSAVLMLTAKDGEYDQTDAFDFGADDYLTKPFSFPILLARLRALARRGAPARPTVLTAGELTLDPSRHLVTKRGEVVAVTPREFGVLEFLIRHQDSVVTKNALLQGVWDANYEGDDNVVEVYIGYLRRKIDVPFDTKTIETVRGVGYRLLG